MLNTAYKVETPENVEVHFDLAGPGSRFCALFLDLLIVFLLLLVIIIAAMVADVGVVHVLQEAGPDDEGGWLTWVNAAVILVLSCVLFGYHAFFEWVMRGQTPGKRAMRIRAIRDDGTPMTPSDVAVRNLIRMVDFLPGMYGVGGLVAFFHPMHKRLGDLAAGTIVVKEGELDYRGATDQRVQAPVAEAVVTNVELTLDERRMITGFLQRRTELLPEARETLAARMAQSLHDKYGGQFVNAESYLERLIAGRHREF